MSDPAPLLNVLLVSGGGFQGLAVLKGLLAAGSIRVVLADCHGENIGRYFAHRSRVVPPIADGSKFLEALFRICEAENIQVIFPSTEFELGLLAECREMFAALGARLAVSGADFLQLVSDKQQLYAFLKREGLPAPEVVDIGSPAVKFPVLGKPRSGWGSKGLIVLQSADELRRQSLPELQERYVWQPWLGEFTEYSIDFAINFTGAISEICVRERVRVSGGFAVVARSREAPEVAAIAERFARLAAGRGGLGLFNLQILRAGDRCFISDVNPRMGTSAVFAYGLGVNLPAFVCSPELTAPAAGPPPDRRPVTMVRYLEELFVRDEHLDAVRGVVFDLDDTLLDQKRWILDKLRGLYAEFKAKLPGQKAFLIRALLIVEEGNRARLIDALGEHFALEPALVKELIEAYRRVCPPEARVYPDVRPALVELKRRGYRLAILTNNPPASQRQKIAAAGLAGDFDEIVYALELNAGKPARAAFVQTADRLRLAPDELVMVGDHLYSDIAGALDSGYRHGFLLARPGGFFNFDVDLFAELSGPGRRFTAITSLRDLLRHLPELR